MSVLGYTYSVRRGVIFTEVYLKFYRQLSSSKCTQQPTFHCYVKKARAMFVESLNKSFVFLIMLFLQVYNEHN